MPVLNTLGQAILLAVDAFISAAHAKGDRDSVQSAVDMASVKRRIQAIIGELPRVPAAGTIPTIAQMQQAQAEPHLPGLEPRPVHVSVNDTPKEPGWDALPQPKMPRVDPSWAPNPRPAAGASSSGWSSSGTAF